MRACVCAFYPGGLDKLLAGEWLIVRQNTQRGCAHLLQHRVDPELHEVVHAVHQQLQVPWTCGGGGGRGKQREVGVMDDYSFKELRAAKKRLS